MPTSHIVVNDYAGVCVVTFADSALLEARTIEQVAKDLYHLVDSLNKQKIILDFSAIKTFSSLGLGVLLTMKKKLLATKGELALCGVRPEIMKLFSLSQLEREFMFFPDDAAALKACGIRVS